MRDVPVSGALGAGTASLWAEQLSRVRPDDEVLLSYGKSNGWLDEQPAMITRRCRPGSIAYLGAVLDPDLMRSVIAWAPTGAQSKPEFGAVPAGVEVCRRVDGQRTRFCAHQSQSCPQLGRANRHQPAYRTACSDERCARTADRTATSVDLAPQGVAVLESDAP